VELLGWKKVKSPKTMKWVPQLVHLHLTLPNDILIQSFTGALHLGQNTSNPK